MKAREIEAYITSDGKLFTDEDKANEHQLNIVGELLDELLPNDDRGNVTRSDRFNLLTKMMNDEPKLKSLINELHVAINH